VKKGILVLIVGILMLGCSSGESSVLNSGNGGILEAIAELEDFSQKDEKILIIVGEGGPSGKMFIRAAETSRAERGGVIYEVASGDEFISAIKDFFSNYGEIDHLEYFGHGNHVGLYVNQAANVNGGLYVNDPELNEAYLAASIYEVDKDIFSEYGWIKFNGCNVADGYPEEDTLAQRMANYFDVDIVAPMGPTEFSKVPYAVDPIENSNYLAPDFSGDVYMVTTYSDQGFVVVRPQEVGESGYLDVRVGHSFQQAVEGLVERGLKLNPSGDEFFPYKNVFYSEAVVFCETVFGRNAGCYVSGYDKDDKIRNLHALQMFVDAYGAEVGYSNPWHSVYISWANERNLLTQNFVNKKWYTRGEMAELAWGFVGL
jgi:hypothetical protein